MFVFSPVKCKTLGVRVTTTQVMVRSQTGELPWLNNNHPWDFCSDDSLQPVHFPQHYTIQSHTSSACTDSAKSKWSGLHVEIKGLFVIICQNSVYKHSACGEPTLTHVSTKGKSAFSPVQFLLIAVSKEPWILCWADSTLEPHRKLFTFWREDFHCLFLRGSSHPVTVTSITLHIRPVHTIGIRRLVDQPLPWGQ